MCVQMMKLEELAWRFTNSLQGTAQHSGQRINLQKGMAAEASWQAHIADLIRHLEIAMLVLLAGGTLVAKVHTGQRLILEYSPHHLKPQINTNVRRNDQGCAVLWRFHSGVGTLHFRRCGVLSLTARRYAISEEQRSEPWRQCKGAYLVSGTPYVALANIRAQVPYTMYGCRLLLVGRYLLPR